MVSRVSDLLDALVTFNRPLLFPLDRGYNPFDVFKVKSQRSGLDLV